jgi:hypothetical protein
MLIILDFFLPRLVGLDASGTPHHIISRATERGQRLATEKHPLLDVETNACMSIALFLVLVELFEDVPVSQNTAQEA